MSMIRNHFFRKTGERFFVGEITCKIASGLFINYTYNSALLLKFIGNTFANPLYAASLLWNISLASFADLGLIIANDIRKYQ